MNSAVGPIFNVFFFLNKILMGPVNSAWNLLNSTYCLLKVEMRASGKKKKAGETPIQMWQKLFLPTYFTI